MERTIPWLFLCGGMKQGMKMTRCSPCTSATSSARRRCPKCGGLKVPPRSPSFNVVPSSHKGLVLVAKDLILNRTVWEEESIKRGHLFSYKGAQIVIAR